MGHVKDFFKEKKAWSIIKDQIIDYYLSPYIAKILATGKPLIIVDCFAGKGVFDDGEAGSPVIIAEHLSHVINNDKQKNKEISGVFIEKKYHQDLECNLASYQRCSVLPGTFEENLEKILEIDSVNNVFIYVDPYGIKSLDFNQFKRITQKGFNSIEMLLNFNSFGFLREGCRLLSCDEAIPDYDDNDTYELDETNNLEKMDRIANGDYWREIVNQIREQNLSMLEAEELFIKKYIDQIESLFKYVVNIPIKNKIINVPKYRLVFGSNSPDGLLLMVDNMHQKWGKMMESQRHGQAVLFDYEFADLSLYKDFDLNQEIITLLKIHNGSMPLINLIVELIKKFGITYDYKHYTDVIKTNSLIKVTRIPEITPTGRKATSMDYKRYKIWVSI